jgi:hypothetical protein
VLVRKLRRDSMSLSSLGLRVFFNFSSYSIVSCAECVPATMALASHSATMPRPACLDNAAAAHKPANITSALP